MKIFKMFLMVAVVIGMGSVVSCSKETDAEKIKAAGAEVKVEADAAAAGILDKK